ncbi:MAG: PH domain-containing protein [Parcubacteria group bacterium]|nr:PH domain-containing protein [Parcubacteria group bacterium]
MPIGLNFPGKEKDERVVMLRRRHLFILFKQNSIFLLYFLIPVAIYAVAKFWLTSILNFPIYPIFVLLISVYYSFFLLFLLIEWIDYYFDVWVITNKRLIDVDQIGLFKRVVSETRLDRIQDVTVDITGLFGTLFHYGNVHVQTAARTQRFEIRQVSNPAEIRTTILNMYDEYTRRLAKKGHHAPSASVETTPSQPMASESPTAPTNEAQPQPESPASSPTGGAQPQSPPSSVPPSADEAQPQPPSSTPPASADNSPDASRPPQN